ncbi:helix-turn-helix domain-containing protein [Streptomyces sp. NPDC093064]|uniref:helix-turn-helix domain-containing protein n=2 Tax=Streptomyces TaxID=1883 RepID=UPI003817B915
MSNYHLKRTEHRVGPQPTPVVKPSSSQDPNRQAPTDLGSVMSLGADGSLRYAVCMRYPQSGVLTPERQAFRERIRMEAAERFGAGASNAEVAKDLRVSVRSVQRWRRAWQRRAGRRWPRLVPLASRAGRGCRCRYSRRGVLDRRGASGWCGPRRA